MTAGDGGWLAPLRKAYLRPWTVAQTWQDGGGKVVGLLGRSVPREFVVAAGMLPIRLSPLRLHDGAGGSDEPLPAGLASELAPGPARVLSALLSGALSWLDAIIIGRDSEAHTKLFYVVRELLGIGEAEQLPPVAFADLLRLPARTSARYNRIRARELIEVIGGWAGRAVGPSDLATAVADSAATAAHLRRIDERRTAGAPGVRGSEALIAAGGAGVLPGSEAQSALARATAGDPRMSAARARVFVSGSGEDDPWIYETLEDAGLAVVGEDHEWGDDGRVPPLATRDPLDGIVDRYHLGPAGAARSGWRERGEESVRRVQRTGADAVMQIVFGHDEAPGWELPLLRELLGEAVPVVPVRLTRGDRDGAALADGVERLIAAVGCD